MTNIFKEIVPVAMAQITQVSINQTAESYLVDKLTTVKNIILAVLGILVVIMILLAGFQFLTAAGDPKKVEAAKNKIIYAVIGIAVMAVAATIPAFVANFIK